MKHTFGKRKRLKSRKAIAALFSDGLSMRQFPLRMVFRIHEAPRDYKHPIQVAVSVPAKIHRKASDRNQLKRRLREAYRLNQHLLDVAVPSGVDIILIYTHRESGSYRQIEKAVVKLLHRLRAKLDEQNVALDDGLT